MEINIRTCRVFRLYRELKSSPIGLFLGASPDINIFSKGKNE